MDPYHKIHSVFKRDNRGRFILGDFSRPELEYLLDNEWDWTEKVDGTNIRMGLADVGGDLDFWIGGRNRGSEVPKHIAEIYNRKTMLNKLLKKFDHPITLYGEGYGPKIQKIGKLYRNDHSFVLFDVKIGQWWLSRENVEEIGKSLGLDVVPIIFRGTLREAIARVIPGIQSTWGDFQSEGLIGKPVIPLFSRDGKRVVIKVKTADFDRLSREGINLDDWR